MKAHLMYADRDFDLTRQPPSNALALLQDLAVGILLNAMAGGDEFLLRVANIAVLSSLNRPESIRYRQRALRDCLANSATVVEIYHLAEQSIAAEHKIYGSLLAPYPDGILRHSLEVLHVFVKSLKRLRRIADDQARGFTSEAFTGLFTMLSNELNDDYFAKIEEHFQLLRFRDGVLISANLGKGNKGVAYVLRRPASKRNWIERLSGRGRPDAHGFEIAEDDGTSVQALQALRDQGINPVANAVAQSMNHILNFFIRLRQELGFYVGCLNLHRRLEEKGEPTCFPVPIDQGKRSVTFRGLYDPCLSLSMQDRVVGNDISVGKRSLVVITGANRGGKSTFLRSIGLAQLMMQCGMFVSAVDYRSDVSTRLFTHYKREEDRAMEKGKLDEELSRMREIANEIEPDSVVLLNESFASTNESEGAQIAEQIIDSLLDADVKVVIVTHLYELAERLYREKGDVALFLRAERLADGRRSFKLIEAGPLPTSFGADLYEQIFGAGETGSISPRSTRS